MEMKERGQNIFFVMQMLHPKLNEGDESRLNKRIILFEQENTLDLLQKLFGADLSEEGEVSCLSYVAEEVDREGYDLGVVDQESLTDECEGHFREMGSGGDQVCDLGVHTQVSLRELIVCGHFYERL